MGTEENNPDRVFLPHTPRNTFELAPQPQFRPPTTSGRHDVFLSYARSDGEAFANAIRQRLNQDLPSLPVLEGPPRD